MFDYANLSANEFEIICSDILSRELGVELRHFSPGRDGGVDLTESPTKRNVVVQVKHYIKSDNSKLIASLKKELEKLKGMVPKPGAYYICTSKDLPAEKIKEIREIFSDYMDSDKYIFTKNELDDFLTKESNQDILRKNFKLWLVADQVLTQVINRDVFIDGEVLLDNLERDFKYFVQTKHFDSCVEILGKHRKVMIYGEPGVGKSITSKMLTFYFVKQGYRIRYTTNGEISDLKRSLQDNKELKEVILLDDCLGQYYLKLREWQDTELISLMNYISLCENKILILNSRITVLNEAQGKYRKFKEYLEGDKVKIKLIDMGNITWEEKANIFYNHLLKNQIPSNHYASIRKNKKYVSIINHDNYNPRIIEYVTHPNRYSSVAAENYYDFIIKTLNNPEEVWEEEFRQGLDIADRVFMHTLFSLTDTLVDIDVLKESFINRIKKLGTIDNTTNKFEESKRRLNESLIRLVDYGNNLLVGVLNPSINDYMKNAVLQNELEVNDILTTAVYIEQIEKVLGDAVEENMISMLEDGSILEKKSLYNKIPVYIIYAIVNYRIMNLNYRMYIREGFSQVKKKRSILGKNLNKADFISKIFGGTEIFDYYGIKELLEEESFRQDLITDLSLTEVTEVLEILNSKAFNEEPIFKELLDSYKTKIGENMYNLRLERFITLEACKDISDAYYDKKEDEYQEALKALKQLTTEWLTHNLMTLIFDGMNKDEFKIYLEEAIEQFLDEELESLVRWQIAPEPNDDYPDDRHDDFEESYTYDLDMILDRDIE
ncbi:restriction endonuclease [Bacillus toyonensis]|uniref:AAA family ATPase n=1 Tax=Bacillus toyonensis TaxID=155322 RepID=A0A2C4QR20_9BACI|nr:restriction endonuclease [Bacillus toyonensis]PGB04694.1 AAA family ATPase [Bacillus toyonensis]PHD66953.1 AAA family ATPase [Bacillus toyonensis]